MGSALRDEDDGALLDAGPRSAALELDPCGLTLLLIGRSFSSMRAPLGDRGEDMTGGEITSRSLPFDFPYCVGWVQ